MNTTVSLRQFERDIGGSQLNILMRNATLPLEELCDFALRNNPNRKILVVSRVVGRHIPVKPSVALNAFSLLAENIPTTLEGPVVFIGLAESAIGLGHGVFEAYKQKSGRTSDLLFIHSSRHKLASPVYVYFEEEHSHATQEYIYKPLDPYHDKLFQSARSVVIVDDELTTGRTIQNLAGNLHEHMKDLESIVVANLTDWRTQPYIDGFASQMPVPSTVVSLLEGEMTITGGPEVKKMPPLKGNNLPKDNLVSSRYGRQGLQELYLSTDVITKALALAKGRTLILATEEFAYPPLALAHILERCHCNIYYQSTTRTPIIVGHGAVSCVLEFQDNYGDGITNFVYNLAPGMYDSIILCHETPHGSLDSKLVEQLGAHTLRFV
jgi:hypothetical protein